jgi:transcriptional regulator GlxA family with amidase domain
MPEYLARPADPLVERFEAWARGHLDAFTMKAASRAVAASERTLERRVRAALGKSPLALVQDLRVAAAVERLTRSDASIDEIAGQVGYQDGATLRALLRRKTGRGVRELRRGL